MKKLLYLSILLASIIFISSCGSNKTSAKKSETAATQNDTIRIANDSLEYEIVIIEPGFYGWLATQPPRGYYTQSTMEIRNNFDVTEYNLRARQPLRFDYNLYPFEIEYQRNVDYGYEVNYMLFNYFIYFKQKYNQRF